MAIARRPERRSAWPAWRHGPSPRYRWRPRNSARRNSASTATSIEGGSGWEEQQKTTKGAKDAKLNRSAAGSSPPLHLRLALMGRNLIQSQIETITFAYFASFVVNRLL